MKIVDDDEESVEGAIEKAKAIVRSGTDTIKKLAKENAQLRQQIADLHETTYSREYLYERLLREYNQAKRALHDFLKERPDVY